MNAAPASSGRRRLAARLRTATIRGDFIGAHKLFKAGADPLLVEPPADGRAAAAFMANWPEVLKVGSWVAAAHANAGLLRSLLRLGVDVTTPVPYELRSAIHLASGHASVSMIRLLVRAGADVNMVSRMDTTPLHAAAWCGRAAAIRYLAACGADPARLDMNGKSIVMLAVEARSVGAVEAAIAVGCDPNLVDPDCPETPLDVARASGAPAAMVSLLEAAGAVSTEELPQIRAWRSLVAAAPTASAHRMHALFAATRKHVPRDADYTEPMSAAIRAGNVKGVAGLLRAGWNPNWPGVNDTAALMVAAAVDAGEIAAVLLRDGADPRMFTFWEGLTALDIARAHGSASVIEILTGEARTRSGSAEDASA